MALDTQSSGILRFATFEVDLRAGELRKQGKCIKVQEQPFHVLTVLLQRPGEVVTREELRTQNWPPDTFVDFDNSLNTAINKLREALGDSAANPRFIETLPRRGYRFIAPVNGMDGGAATPDKDKGGDGRESLWRFRWIVAVVSLAVLAATLFAFNVFRVRERVLNDVRVPPIQSLAVLPLTNLSGDPAQEYFSDGMTDALITDLAQMGSVKVISRTSSMRFRRTDKSLPEIARELNVDGIVEGTVQRSGDRVRITAQLIYGPADKHLWASSYERNVRDVLALQEELARAIVGEIKVKLTLQEQVRLGTNHSVNPEAYEVYLRGLAFSKNHGEQSTRISTEYFNRAIQIDPQWAAPYAQLARSYHWIGSSGHPEFYAKSKTAALHAIGIDDSLAEAHSALAYVLHNYDWNWSGAESEYKRALELNPNYSEAHHGYAVLLAAAGRNEQAVAEIRRAEELDPLLIPLQVNLGVVLSCAGRQKEAIEQLQNTTDLNPKYSYARMELGMAYLRKGMYPEAVANLEKAVAAGKDDPDELLYLGALAYGYAVAGRNREALKLLRELERQEANGKPVAAGWDTGLYPVYFALGQKDQAFGWLEKAYKQRSDSLLYLRCWPEFDRLRVDPRFADLVRRVGIPE
jgi:TolB-like protein/DNA-binding winged helix-turn-helix (wHTH) protein/tetratricopeptide (TPR) repeat protein